MLYDNPSLTHTFKNGALKIPYFFNPEYSLDLFKNLKMCQAHYI